MHKEVTLNCIPLYIRFIFKKEAEKVQSCQQCLGLL